MFTQIRKNISFILFYNYNNNTLKSNPWEKYENLINNRDIAMLRNRKRLCT